jgi:hypothetical protein
MHLLVYVGFIGRIYLYWYHTASTLGSSLLGGEKKEGGGHRSSPWISHSPFSGLLFGGCGGGGSIHSLEKITFCMLE